MLGVIEQKIKVASRPFYLSLQETDCLEWSADNRIVLITPVSIIIYDVEHSCSDTNPTLGLKQYICSTPDTPNASVQSAGSTLRSVAVSGGSNQYNTRRLLVPLLLSAPLSCVARCAVTRSHSSVIIPPGQDVAKVSFKRARWSPQGAAGEQSCLLACLSSDHQLLLASGRGRFFRPSIDLTTTWKIWLEDNEWPLEDATKPSTDSSLNSRGVGSIAKSNLDLKKNTEEILKHRNILSQLAIRDICWSPIIRTGDTGRDYVSELLHVTITGHAVVWTLNYHKQKHQRELQKQDQRPVKNEHSTNESPSTITEDDESGVAAATKTTSPKNKKGVESSSNKSKLIDNFKQSTQSKKKSTPQRKTDAINNKQMRTPDNLTGHVQGSWDLQVPQATCTRWLTVPTVAELLLVGESSGLLKVFRVSRDQTGAVCDVIKVATLFSNDRYSVTSMSVVESPSPTEDTSGSGGCELLLAVARNAMISVALLRVTAQSCDVVSTAEAHVARVNITSIISVSRENIYCSIHDGTFLNMTIVWQTPLQKDNEPPQPLGSTSPSPSTDDTQVRSPTKQSSAVIPNSSLPTKKRRRVSSSRLNAPKNRRTSQSSSKDPVSDKEATNETLASTEKENRNKDTTQLDYNSPNPTSTSDALNDNNSSITPSVAHKPTTDVTPVRVCRVTRSGDSCEHTEVLNYTTPSGFSYKVEVICKSYGNTKVALSLRRRSVKEFVCDGSMYLAAAASPNKVFIATIESLRVPYDHLVMRECSQLNVFLVSSASCLQAALGARYAEPLHKMADLLSAVRLNALRGDHLNMTSLLDHVQQTSQSAAPTCPRDLLLLWLAQMYTSIGPICQDTTPCPSNYQSWDDVETRVLERVLQRWLESVVCRYHGDLTWTDQQFTAPLKQALSLMCDYCVEKGPSQHSNMAMTVLRRLYGGSREQCIMGRCQLIVNLDSLTQAKCADGHVIGRCCRSLLSVRQQSVCQLCATVVHQSAADICGTVAPACLVCGGVVQPVLVSAQDAEQIKRSHAMLPKVIKPMHLIRSRRTSSKNTTTSAKRI